MFFAKGRNNNENSIKPKNSDVQLSRDLCFTEI